jgi:hypothetical protein
LHRRFGRILSKSAAMRGAEAYPSAGSLLPLGSRGSRIWHESGRATGAQTISLAERRVFSRSFKPLYDEGMGLVEQAAEYLDGRGRVEARGLSRLRRDALRRRIDAPDDRLMQVASWLLLQRAANSGEMTRDQVAAEKVKVRLDTSSARGRRRAGTSFRGPSAISWRARCACRRWCGAWTRKSMARRARGTGGERESCQRADYPASHCLRARLIRFSGRPRSRVSGLNAQAALSLAMVSSSTSKLA